MLVSVIVATRNRPAALAVALAAVSRQSHSEIELILVDDGSSADDRKTNAEELAATGRTTRYLYLTDSEEGGSGPSFARNAGLRAAQGELVAFCDDDDEWCDDGHLAAACAAFAELGELDLLFANQQTRFAGRVVSEEWLPLLGRKLDVAHLKDGAIVPLTKPDCLIDHFPQMNICVFRRSLLEKIGGFWEGVRYSEDMDVYVRAVEVARTVAFRHHTVSIHNAPDPHLQQNASTRINAVGKDLALVSVAHHILERCPSLPAQRYARRVGGYAFRRLARAAREAGNPKGARAFARLGLALLPTARWAAYTSWLSVRRLVD